MSHIKFNIAQLLRQEIGAQREYRFTEPTLPLDDTLVLREVHGTVHFTRTATGVCAHIWSHGTVQLTCVRSLELFDYAVTLDVTDEFHATVDVIAGVPLAKPTEEDPFLLDELHMADIGEAIREYTLLELPINPVCAAYRDHPVGYTIEIFADDDPSTTDDTDEVIDERLAILKSWKHT
jgi:uncharacterized protein